MAPVLNTYGIKKKKSGRLPKYLSGTDDVFESLNISKIKETKALLEERGKLKSSKKKKTVRKPFFSMGHYDDADSTFDKLLKERPIRRSLNIPESSDSDSSSSSYSSDFCSRPKRVTLGKKKVRKTSVKGRTSSKGSCSNTRKQSKKSAEESFFTKLSVNDKKLTREMKGREDSLFEAKDVAKKVNEKSQNVVFESNDYSSPFVLKGKESKLLSPILPINMTMTSTPCGQESRNAYERLLGPRLPHCDTAFVVNESAIDKIPVNGSVDMFSSFECREIGNSLPVHEVSVDLFASHQQSIARSAEIFDGSQDKYECIVSNNCPSPLESAIKANLNFMDEFRENPPVCDTSTVDVTGLDDTDVSSLGAVVNDEKFSFQENDCAEEAEVISNNTSDPSIKDCVVMLSRCDLSEQPACVTSLLETNSLIAQDRIEDLNPSLHRSPSSHQGYANLPLRGCRVVLHRCDSFDGTSCSVEDADCSYNSCIELEPQSSVVSPPIEHMKPMNDKMLRECKVVLSRCDDSGSASGNTLANMDAIASSFDSLVQESICKPLTCARPSHVTRQSLTPVVLKPGKHWRRSLSILSKIRTSLDEPSSRKSLAFNEGKFKGKLWESSVNSLIQLQSRTDIIFEGLEESVTSLHSNESLSKVIEDSNRDDSIIICETSQIDPETSTLEVLRRCGQEKPLPFLQCYPSSMKKHCKKIGEGVYGEVFLYSEARSPVSVIKIIPIEGDLELNGEPQKTFIEIFSEVCVAQELSDLRKGSENIAWTFNEVQAIRCVQGSYPVWLQELWHDYNDTKGSENDCPDIFQEDQLFIVLELRHGGQDLESFVFSSADQGLAAFNQIALTLAVGERALRFEHRDLHWGNVLIASTKSKTVDFILNGETRKVLSKGVEISIIDFTLSRISNPATGCAVFYDLSKDETLFTAQGDYQFEIYRLMKEYSGNKWNRFTPKTNIAWLHYLLDKLCSMVRYKNRMSKLHNNALNKLHELKDAVLMFDDVASFVNCPLFCK